MSILKNLEAVPTRMRDIFDFVSSTDEQIDKEYLRKLFMPPNGRDRNSTAVLDVPISVCEKLGLFEEDAGLIKISSFYRANEKTSFKDIIFKVLFDVELAKSMSKLLF